MSLKISKTLSKLTEARISGAFTPVPCDSKGIQRGAAAGV